MNPEFSEASLFPVTKRSAPIEAVHFGALLLARKLVNSEQLSHALTIQTENPYLRIGEILLGLGYLSFAQLKSTLEDQYRDVLLGQTLLKLGIVTVSQLEAALESQERTGSRLAPALIDLGACSESQIYRALAIQE